MSQQYSAFLFFTVTATTEIYTLSLHDALPIYGRVHARQQAQHVLQRPHLLHLPHGAEEVLEVEPLLRRHAADAEEDRKSTRLNSSHSQISYAVFCLKKKKPKIQRLYI